MTDFKQEIKELLNSADSEVLDMFFHSTVESAQDGFDSAYSYETDGGFFGDLIGKEIEFSHIENHGGEGMGEEYWSVYKFTKVGEELYVQFNGWYQSFNGSEFTEWFFVKPKQVMVTQFDKTE